MNKWLKIAGGGIAVGIVILVIYLLIPRATIVLSVAPESFSVSVNEEEAKLYEMGDRLEVTPGTHRLTISRDGFEDYTTSVTIKNRDTFEVLYALTPQTDAARELLETERSQEIIQRITNQRMESELVEISKNYPIVEILPIRDKFFTVSTCTSEEFPDDTTKIAICVDLYEPQARASVSEVINARGHSLEDYEVRFTTRSNGEERSE